jgi:hypothetical protein
MLTAILFAAAVHVSPIYKPFEPDLCQPDDVGCVGPADLQPLNHGIILDILEERERQKLLKQYEEELRQLEQLLPACPVEPGWNIDCA